jgi:hypothetical protein
MLKLSHFSHCFAPAVADFRVAVFDYMNARVSLDLEPFTTADERSKKVAVIHHICSRLRAVHASASHALLQVRRLRLHHIRAAVDRFRHDSGFLKIALHALFKTYVFVATASSGSYIIMLMFFSLSCLLMPLAAAQLFYPQRLPLSLSPYNFVALFKASCKAVVFIVCFSLPIFIQQGDMDAVVSPPNLSAQAGADPGCMFFFTEFNRSQAQFSCTSGFLSNQVSLYFAGVYPSVFYICPLRMSRMILCSPPHHLPPLFLTPSHHTHTLSLPFSLSLSHTHTHTHTHACTHIHTHTHTRKHMRSNKRTNTLTFTLSLLQLLPAPFCPAGPYGGILH